MNQPQHSGINDVLNAIRLGDAERARSMTHAKNTIAKIKGFIDTGKYRRVLAEEAAEISRRRDMSTRPPARVLLAEDDVEFASKMAGLIRRSLSVEVVEAHSVAEAATALNGGEFAAVVADIDLTDGLGVEVIERAREIYGDVPVVLMSGYLQEHLAAIEERVGAQGRFDKTSDPNELIEAIRRVTAYAA